MTHSTISSFFFFNDTATTEIYTLSLHDALPISTPAAHTTAYFENIVYRYEYDRAVREGYLVDYDVVSINSNVRMNGVFLQEGAQIRSEEHTSELQSLTNLVCRLLLEKKKKKTQQQSMSNLCRRTLRRQQRDVIESAAYRGSFLARQADSSRTDNARRVRRGCNAASMC